MKRGYFAGIILAAAILGIWHYTANGTPEARDEENTLLSEALYSEDKTGGKADHAAVRCQDSMVLDAGEREGRYSKTFVVSEDTEIPISTTITVDFTYESNNNGGYSVVSVDSVKAENNSGWTCVDREAAVNGDILYSNEKREATIPIVYQASLGDGLRSQECLIRLDLSQE